MKTFVAALLFSLLFGCDRALPPSPPKQKFGQGERVKLVSDPRYNNGIVYNTWCGTWECFYHVRFGLYSVEYLRDFELEKLK